jgi:hypothetical protein
MLNVARMKDLPAAGRRGRPPNFHTHGNWLPWLEGEFGWSDETARKFMRVHDMVKSQQCWNLESIEVSALSLLAAPSTPKAARAIANKGAPRI